MIVTDTRTPSMASSEIWRGQYGRRALPRPLSNGHYRCGAPSFHVFIETPDRKTYLSPTVSLIHATCVIDLLLSRVKMKSYIAIICVLASDICVAYPGCHVPLENSLTTSLLPVGTGPNTTTTPFSTNASDLNTSTWSSSTLTTTSTLSLFTATASESSVSSAGLSILGSCENSADLCVGDVTHWDGGLGTCETIVFTGTELAIALPKSMIGGDSYSTLNCNRTVTLHNPVSGTTAVAIVRDKCMGCENRAIDCTDLLFDIITDGKGDGRQSGIEWWFSS